MQPFIGCQPVARPSTLRGAQKVWSSAGRFFREARLRLVSVEGKLPPWSRTIRPRIRPGSSLDPSSKTGVLPDRRPSEGMWPRFLIVPWEESLASLAGGGDAPSNPLAVRPRAFTVGGGMPWARWEAKRCGPPLFFLNPRNLSRHVATLIVQVVALASLTQLLVLF